MFLTTTKPFFVFPVLASYEFFRRCAVSLLELERNAKVTRNEFLSRRHRGDTLSRLSLSTVKAWTEIFHVRTSTLRISITSVYYYLVDEDYDGNFGTAASEVISYHFTVHYAISRLLCNRYCIVIPQCGPPRRYPIVTSLIAPRGTFPTITQRRILSVKPRESESLSFFRNFGDSPRRQWLRSAAKAALQLLQNSRIWLESAPNPGAHTSQIHEFRNSCKAAFSVQHSQWQFVPTILCSVVSVQESIKRRYTPSPWSPSAEIVRSGSAAARFRRRVKKQSPEVSSSRGRRESGKRRRENSEFHVQPDCM